MTNDTTPGADATRSSGLPAASTDAPEPPNVTDVSAYLDSVKLQFQDTPGVYYHFLDVMQDFKNNM